MIFVVITSIFLVAVPTRGQISVRLTGDLVATVAIEDLPVSIGRFSYLSLKAVVSAEGPFVVSSNSLMKLPEVSFQNAQAFKPSEIYCESKITAINYLVLL